MTTRSDDRTRPGGAAPESRAAAHAGGQHTSGQHTSGQHTSNQPTGSQHTGTRVWHQLTGWRHTGHTGSHQAVPHHDLFGRLDLRKAILLAALGAAALLALGAGTGYVATNQLRPLTIATGRSLFEAVPPSETQAGRSAIATPAVPSTSPSRSAAPTRTTKAAAPPQPLQKRITRTSVALPTRMPYAETGYNLMPQWRRIDTARAPGGTVYVAWQGSDGVHVTKLTPALTRAGSDVVVSGAAEISGLVAHDDGFALLTRRADENKFSETAAHLVRYRGTTRIWDAQLTSQDKSDDTAPVLGGQLRWDGTRYGAYFIVHGADGFADGYFGDKLVYVDDAGRRVDGGWNWGCSHNEGIALLPRVGKDFASLCFEDWRSGLFVNTGLAGSDKAAVISREECWPGYCGGNFGGFVALSGGRYAVAFSTRGASRVEPDQDGRGFRVTARFDTHQVAVAFLDDASSPAGRPLLISTDRGVDHVNVRLAPYGKDRLLLAYDTVSSPTCRMGTCAGRFSGTHLQLLDLHGQPVGAPVTVPDRIAGDIAVLDDGDLAWAYAPVTPSYDEPLTGRPTVGKLSVARLDLQPAN